MALWEKPSGKESLDTGQPEQSSRTLESIRRAWRCSHCGELMYLKDRKGYPKAGAPPAKFVSAQYDRVCSLCWDMYMAISCRSYWKNLHDLWKDRGNKIKKLKPGEDYFA